MSLANVQGLSEVIDYHELLTRCLNNLSFAERMLALFQNRCGEDLAELERAFDQGDLELSRRLAHRLAGASANAAAFGVQSRAAELRRAISDNDLERSRQSLNELRHEWNRFTAAMSSEQLTHETS